MRKQVKWISLLICFALLASLIPTVPVAEAAEIQQSEELYYGRYALSTMERAEVYLYAYDQIVAGVESVTEAISVYNGVDNLSKEELSMVVEVYTNDHGGHFWFGNSYSYSLSSKTVYNLFPNYIMTGDQLTQAKQKFNERVEDILSGITPTMTEFEKELYIHDMLVDRNTYDYGDNCYSAYGALVDGASVCDGYAKAFQHLLMCAGIQSFRAVGYANGGGHAWNYVRIDGKYYLTDPTWNDSGDGGYHNYFNLTDQEMGMDHWPDAVAYPLPVCNSDEADYYSMSGRTLGKDNISVEKFTQLLLEGDLFLDVSYDGSGTDLVNWFYEHMAEIKALANIHGDFSFYYGGGEGTVTIRIAGVDAAVVKDGQVHYYADIDDALAACNTGSILRLREDLADPITISQKLILDLNGCNITGDITGAENLYIMDSKTDDYYINDTAGCGVVSGAATDAAAMEGYVAIAEGSGTTYHKVDIALTKVNLKAGQVGVYYTAKFRYDQLVEKYLAAAGVALSTANETPVADDSDPTSRYTISSNSVLVRNILEEGADNAARGKMLIYARAYLKMADGTILYSQVSATNLKTLVETVDATAWAKLTGAQKDTLKTMYANFADVMGAWKINNLKCA